MNGYNSLAGYMGTYPNLAVFRRYLILHARDLLCMQGEIVNLDHELRMAIENDREDEDPVRNQFEYDISALKGPHASESAGVQWSRTLELRRLLKDYGEALLRFAALCRLAPVDKANLSAVHELLEKPYGSGRTFLTTYEFETWDEENIPDLASLAGRHTDRDALSKWIDKLIRHVYHPLVGHRLHDPLSVVEAWGSESKPGPVIDYPDSHITAAIDTISTILASLLPALSVLGLFFIHNPLARMVAIVGCTFVFSTVLTIVARPKRAQCFAITSAFTAVLVVFLGGSNGSVS